VDRKVTHFLLAIALVGVGFAASTATNTFVTINVSESVAEAANPAKCGDPVEIVRNPMHTAVSNVVGPAYFTAKWRNESPRVRDQWWNPHTQPWNNTIKSKVKIGEQTKLYGAEVHAVMYRPTIHCWSKVNKIHRTLGLPYKSLNTLEQWGLAEWYRVGK